MPDTVISVENISKQYRLGTAGTGTLSHDLKRWWYNVRGMEDPYLKIGETNDRSKKGESEYVWSLRDINFDIQQGEALGIIGRNGAGKSTLLKILSKVTSPTTGQIKVKGRIASLLEVGTGFHPELSGRENVFLNGAIMGMRKDEIKSKFDEIVDFSGVERYIDTPVKRYSSGMYVRLAFAVAAHLEPEILIVDEVLAVGDMEFQKKCLGKMQDVSGHGRTVLFVSHNMAAIRKLCSKGVFLETGRVKSVGEIDEIIESYMRVNGDATTRTVKFQPKENKAIYFEQASVYAKGKDADVTFDITDELIVRITYVVTEDIKGTNIAVSLSKDGILLLRTWDIDNNPELFIERKKGTYTAEIALPDYLVTGNYSIHLACGRPGIGAIDVREDCLVFELENSKIDGAFNSLTRGGIIKSDLKWNFFQS
ncbi:ABC transporter ATP-binding protein [Inquilinus sp. KBS0705]|nr:ABC transporter ATP-binding protein [Inquilinus sp. KBS0705]